MIVLHFLPLSKFYLVSTHCLYSDKTSSRMVLPGTCYQGTTSLQLEVTPCNGQGLVPAEWETATYEISYQSPHNAWFVEPYLLFNFETGNSFLLSPPMREQALYWKLHIPYHCSPKREGLLSSPFYRGRNWDLVNDSFTITQKVSHKINFNSVWSEFSITPSDLQGVQASERTKGGEKLLRIMKNYRNQTSLGWERS